MPAQENAGLVDGDVMGIIDNGYPDEDESFRNRECYEFNTTMGPELDDARCVHCLHFMTLDCPHIEEFIDEEEE